MRKVHYVSNEAFLQALIEYKAACKSAEELNQPKPRVPEYIGECILKIATHLSYKPNFLGYPFREEMCGDGIENSLLYLSNFNTEKYKNPFAYFTQIMWYAFLRRIFKEKKQLYVKYKCIQNSCEFTDYVNQTGDEKSYQNTYVEYLRQNMNDIIGDFEEKKAKKKKKKAKGSLEKFFGSEVEPQIELEKLLVPEILLEEEGE